MDCHGGDQAVGDRAAAPTGFIEEASGDFRMFESEAAMAVHDLQSEFFLCPFDRAAQELGPSCSAHHNRLVAICGLQKTRSGRSLYRNADQEARVQVDQRCSLKSRPKDSLRILADRRSQASKSTPRAATDS